ncbi:MAG: AMP-binding protein [Rhodobacterales bacterium]|nr:AMP-binding protein [Rhodobacterales bacterium]
MAFNLADLFEALADSFPDRMALVSSATALTFGELDDRATRMANHWAGLGVGPGDHIGLYLYNRHEYIVSMLAAYKLRAVTINLNYRYVAEELRYVCENADLVGVVYESELVDVVNQAMPDHVRFRIAAGQEFAAILAGSSSKRSFDARSDDDLFIVYTGGTTGMPRGVMWRHEDLFFAALQGGNPGGVPFESIEEMTAQLTKNGEGINIHPCPPLIHGAAMLASWIAMLNGGVAIISEGRSFVPEESLDLSAKYQAHTINIVGDAMALPLVKALRENPDRWDLSNLLVIASAGAVLSGSIRERLEALLPHVMIMNNFGASETGHQGTAFYEDGKVIWIMDDRHTTVVDENLNRIQPGSGEVGKLARFGRIPLGYYGDKEKTARTFFEKDGVRYVLPGDMASIDADGSVVFLGRGSVCINSGGEKVYCEEVEEALKGHPDVFDAVVVGVPDERWGQRVEALVTVNEGRRGDVASMGAFCRTKLAGYKTPRAIWVVDDLNRQPSGKPDYRWAKARAIELGAK